MAKLTDNVRYIKGIGEKRAALLSKLGIASLYDLISFFPRSWQDRTAARTISQLQPGDEVCVKAIVATEPKLGPGYGSKRSVRFRIADDTGYLNVIYFNNPYVANKLHKGDEAVFFGKVDLTSYGMQMANPDFESVGGIVPIYHLTEGLSQKAISRMVLAGLNACLEILPDALPDTVREEHHLSHARFAYENIHFPKDFTALEQSRRRLIFEELFVLSLALGLLKERRVTENAPRIQIQNPEIFFQQLPFSPTNAQRKCIEEIFSDLRSDRPMNRLVQGDVGSGKTICAAAAAWAVVSSGCQAAFMAPTEILAEQHYLGLTPLFQALGLKTALLKGSMSKKEKSSVCAALEAGLIDLVIGTHALLSEGVVFKNLGLVITDEQHRFGVRQRNALGQKGEDPHTLVMSATPIPRTLALILYGDLDVSVIDELPPGRQRVDTFAVNESMRTRIQAFIRKQVVNGNQVYIVCPMVERGETVDSDLKAATEYAENLQKKIFPDIPVSFVHGKMKAAEKDTAMAAFRSGACKILVATTVIEVGVDVPNATLIVIENAERYGLSQLHQLRGRVGRGKDKSYCVLISDHADEKVKSRLDILCKSNDGFVIAEEDLKLRGPGDFFGSRQHGLPEMKIADLGTDLALLHEAQNAAKNFLAGKPDLTAPEYAPLMERLHLLFGEKRFN